MSSLSSLLSLMAFLSCLLSLSLYSQSKNRLCIPPNKRYGINYFPCRDPNGENYQNPLAGGDSQNKFDRKDVLFGLGGFYDVTTLIGNKFALANSSLSPDVLNCESSKTTAGMKDCCPPKIKEIIDFIPPVIPNPRVRPAVHKMTPTQIADLERGIKIMKSLDANDPRSFCHQAKVHCAYCDHAYTQVGSDPKTNFLIHRNALFFPFHRAYLYFFERIMRDLISKPDFAIPFWNWDSPPGMYMPELYEIQDSPLYHKLRDARHKSPKLLYLNYDGKTEDHPFDIVDCNLRWMNKQMSVKTAREFLGKIIKIGETPIHDDLGSIERSPHNIVHDWVGDPNQPNREDMGAFYAAGRDPLFYAHHANVDRMWNIWQKMGEEPRDHTNPDWLNSSFVLYDENQNAVRIKVSDCLDSVKLGYVYEDVDIPWYHTKRVPREKQWLRTELLEFPTINNFPLILNSDIIVMVDRPELSWTGDQSSMDEVLVIEDVEYDPTTRVHFNVLVNVIDDGEDVCSGNLEFLGSFKNIPHGLEHVGKTSLRFVLTEVIRGLGLEDDKNLAVKIVPKVGGERVRVGGIKIELETLS